MRILVLLLCLGLSFAQAQTPEKKLKFYGGKYALTSKTTQGRTTFYFVDKQGKEIKKFGRWDDALPFSGRRNGFAVGSKKNKTGSGFTSFFIDTLGNQYLSASSVDELTPKTVVFDLVTASVPQTAFSKVFKFSGLQYLILEGADELKAVPPAIKQLKKLKVLNLSQTNITQLPAEIGQLENLEILNLSQTSITQLPVEISNLKNLKVLNLSQTSITRLPAEIGQLKNLEELELDWCKVEILPAEIGQLKKLKKLTATWSKLVSLPSAIGQLTNLTYLNLSSCKSFKEFPPEARQLKKLEFLHIGWTPITRFPPGIEQFKNLKMLDITWCTNLTRVPSGNTWMKKLDYKYLNNIWYRVNRNIRNINQKELTTPEAKQALIESRRDLLRLTEFICKKWPGYVSTLYHRAYARHNLGRDLEHLMPHTPLNVLLHYYLTAVQDQLLLDELTETMPLTNQKQYYRAGTPYYSLAMFYGNRLGGSYLNYQRAVAWQEKYFERVTEYPKTDQTYRTALYDLAYWYLCIYQYKKAEALARQDLKHNSGESLGYLLLARALLFQKDKAKYEEAQNIYLQKKNKKTPHGETYNKVALRQLAAMQKKELIPKEFLPRVEAIRKMLQSGN